MTEEIHHPDGQIEHPQVRHEHSDASFRAILSILIGAMVFAAVVHYVILQFFFAERRDQAHIKESPYPLAPAPSTALPREPRLEQVDRVAGVETPDVYERQAAREAILNSYGSTQEKGFVHIPIGRAMTLLENKLPSRPQPPAGWERRAGGLVDAGESNSGRMFRRGRER